jgi:hypothetical protein
MRDLERRVRRLEAGSNDDEVTLEELVLWSMRFREREGPLDAETQHRHEDFERRFERSKLCRIFQDMMASAASNRSASAIAIAAPAEPADTTPEPAPASRADPVFEEHRPDGLIKAVPGMRLDVLMALQRK